MGRLGSRFPPLARCLLGHALSRAEICTISINASVKCQNTCIRNLHGLVATLPSSYPNPTKNGFPITSAPKVAEGFQSSTSDDPVTNTFVRGHDPQVYLRETLEQIPLKVGSN